MRPEFVPKNVPDGFVDSGRQAFVFFEDGRVVSTGDTPHLVCTEKKEGKKGKRKR
jgi:hypothetical protein